MKALVLMIALFSGPMSLSAHAQGSGGHGGDAVVCYSDDAKGAEIRQKVVERMIWNRENPQYAASPFSDKSHPGYITHVKQVYSFDLFHAFESLSDPSLPPEFERPYYEGTTDQAIFDFLVDRLKEKTNLGAFVEEAGQTIEVGNWEGRPAHHEIDDSSHNYPMPPHCVLAQVARREGSKVTIDRVLYAAMDALNRSSLWLHEVLGFLKNSYVSMEVVRDILKMAFSQRQHEQLSPRETAEEAQKLFPVGNWNEHRLICPRDVLSGSAVYMHETSAGNFQLCNYPAEFTLPGGYVLTCLFGGIKVEVVKNQKFITYCQGANLKNADGQSIWKGKELQEKHPVHLFSNGEVKGLTLKDPIVVATDLEQTPMYEVSFDNEGRVTQAYGALLYHVMGRVRKSQSVLLGPIQDNGTYEVLAYQLGSQQDEVVVESGSGGLIQVLRGDWLYVGRDGHFVNDPRNVYALPAYKIAGNWLQFEKEPEFYPGTSSVKSGQIANTRILGDQVNWGQIAMYPWNTSQLSLELAKADEVEFYSNGVLKKVSGFGGIQVELSGRKFNHVLEISFRPEGTVDYIWTNYAQDGGKKSGPRLNRGIIYIRPDGRVDWEKQAVHASGK